MTDKPAPRPQQASLSGGLVMTSSVFLVLLAFQRMSTVGSIAFQDSASKTVSDPAFSWLGLSVDDAQTIFRLLCFVTAACGAASAILGWHALHRSLSARLALSVIAPVLLVAGFAVASLPAMFVAIGVVMLWLQPTRDWFLGRETPAVVAPSRTPYPSPPTPRPYPGIPPPTSLAPPAAPPSPPSPLAPPTSQYLPDYLRHAAPGRRPRSVLLACIVTWVACAAMALLSLLSVLVMLVAPDGVLDEARPQLDDAGLGDHEFIVTIVVTGSLLALWSAGAAVLAVGALFRRGWGALGLLVSAGVAGVLCLVTALASPVAVIPLAACGFVLAQLLRADARAWFGRPGARPPHA